MSRHLIFGWLGLALVLGVLLIAARAVSAQQGSAHNRGPAVQRVELGSNEVSVPLSWFDRKPVVEVQINNKGPYRFYLDTGAQGCVVDQKLTEELHIPAVGEGMVMSPGGKGLPAQFVRFDRLELGKAALLGCSAMSFDRSRLGRQPDAPRGVLSACIWPGYLLTLDYAQNRLLIRPGQLPPADGQEILSYDAQARLPEVTLQAAGKEITLHLDSGAPGGITVPFEYAKQLPLVSEPVVVGRGRRVDQEVVILAAKLKGSVKLGMHVLENPDLRFQKIANARGQIGNAVLRQFLVTLDTKNHRVRFEKAPASAGSEATKP